MSGAANSNSDQPIPTIFSYDTRDLCCQSMRKICSGDQKIDYYKMKFSSRWKYEWKSSDKMGPRTLRQPNLRKVDLPWKGRSASILIDIRSSIKAIHKSNIEIMDIHNFNMGVYYSVMYIHNSISDTQTCIMEK